MVRKSKKRIAFEKTIQNHAELCLTRFERIQAEITHNQSDLTELTRDSLQKNLKMLNSTLQTMKDLVLCL